MKKVSILGAGHCGTAVAFYLAEETVAHVMLIDSVEGRARGKALDLMEAAPIRNYDITIDGSHDPKDMEGSLVVVIAAGMVRKPGMMRMDLLEHNQAIIDPIIDDIKKYAPDAAIIVMTEPVDALSYYVIKKGGFDHSKVLGVSGVLDSTRICEFIDQELDVATGNTTSIVLGGHHDYMVILPRYTRVEGIPITELLPPEKIDEIIARTRAAGAEIIGHLKTGSAAYAPAAATAEVVQSIVRDDHRIQCCSSYLQGEYGYQDICLGVPVQLAREGVERIVELELTLQEKDALDRSESVVRNLVNTFEFEPEAKEKA